MVEQFYKNINGNYSEAISRMRDDERIKKYLKFFLMDESFEQLKKTMEAQNCEEAFKFAHTLKGVTKNLAFTDLGNVVEEITELLRNGDLPEAQKLFIVVEEKYNLVISEINKVI